MKKRKPEQIYERADILLLKEEFKMVINDLWHNNKTGLEKNWNETILIDPGCSDNVRFRLRGYSRKY